jgi:hypothetical protein
MRNYSKLAIERLRKLIFPEAPELVMDPHWYQAYNYMLGKYEWYRYYYSGEIFKELADPKRPQESEKKYPLRINLTREWADMLSGYVFGQWDESVVTFTAQRRKQESGNIAKEEEKRCSAMEDFLRDHWVLNDNNAHADVAATDCMVYGGSVVKTYISGDFDKRIKDEWIAPDIFMPRWHPMDVNMLLETIIAYVISREDARDIFNLSQLQYKGLPQAVTVWERWSEKSFSIHVEDITIKDVKNPVGFIPYTYIPRMRSHAANFGYFGISTLDDTIALQNEVNERAADIGDGVAYSSHPIRVVTNYMGSEALEVGPDSLWNLGFGLGGREPKAYTLDTRTNYDEAMKYVKAIEHMGRTSAHLPAIAFGEDEGSQRSGTTLLIRFLPLTQEVRRTRIYWTSAMRQMAMKALALRSREEGAGFTPEDLDGRILNPNFAPVLPKDVAEKVEEWAVRINSGFGTPEEAYRDLGHEDPEDAAERALEYMKDVARTERILRGVQNVSGNRANAQSTSRTVDSGPKKSRKQEKD